MYALQWMNHFCHPEGQINPNPDLIKVCCRPSS